MMLPAATSIRHKCPKAGHGQLPCRAGWAERMDMKSADMVVVSGAGTGIGRAVWAGLRAAVAG